MKTQVEHRFSEFYHNWVWKLEDILHQLKEMKVEVSKQRNEVENDQDLQALISKVTTHLKEYYTVKWASAHEDVLPFFSPAWLTPLENAYSSWFTGWKPSASFCLLGSLVRKPTAFGAMTEEQRRKIEELRMKIRVEEEKVEREMERLQVIMADRKMVDLAKLSSCPHEGVVDGLVEVALKGVMGGLEKVMKAADCVRLKTLQGTLDVLTPLQCVQFLTATLTLHLRLRRWGINTDMAAHKLNSEDK